MHDGAFCYKYAPFIARAWAPSMAPEVHNLDQPPLHRVTALPDRVISLAISASRELALRGKR